MAQESSPNRNRTRGDDGKEARRAQVLSGIRQGARLRTSAETTRDTAEDALRVELREARRLGIPVAEIARESGLPSETIHEITGDWPPFEPRRSRA